jgi:hypothetical protein
LQKGVGHAEGLARSVANHSLATTPLRPGVAAGSGGVCGIIPGAVYKAVYSGGHPAGAARRRK